MVYTKYIGHKLTKEEVQALRKATDSICFDFIPDVGISRIRANSKVGTGEGSTRTVFVEVDSFIRYPAKDFEGRPVLRCYEMVHFPQMAEWQTIADGVADAMAWSSPEIDAGGVPAGAVTFSVD